MALMADNESVQIAVYPFLFFAIWIASLIAMISAEKIDVYSGRIAVLRI